MCRLFWIFRWVDLHKGDWSAKVGTATTDKNGVAALPEVATGTYQIEVYSKHSSSGLPTFNELWGDQETKISRGSNTDTFQRFQPYVSASPAAAASSLRARQPRASSSTSRSTSPSAPVSP